MHLIEKFAVNAIGQCTHRFAVGLAISTLSSCPSPSTGIGIALDGNVLRGSTSRTDSIDGSLIEVGNKSRRLVMKLVVSIKDDLVIVLELCSNSLPESTKVCSRSDDLAVVATVVVRHNDGISTELCDASHSLGQILKVSGIQRTGHLIRHQTLHQEVYSEAVVAFVDECAYRAKVGPGIVGSQLARDVALTKLRPGLIDTDELKLARAASSTLAKTSKRLRHNNARRTCGEKKRREMHIDSSGD